MPAVIPMPEAHMYSAYGVYLLQGPHPLVRRLKRIYEPSVHGHKMWNSSFLVMDYLQHYPPSPSAKVIEIGCGWGPASVFCAKEFQADVTGVDTDRDVFPFLDVIAALNDVQVRQLRKRFEDLTTTQLGTQELLIGADICFWDSMIKPLRNLIGRALKGGTKRGIIADPGRPTFYELADLCSKRWRVNLQAWYSTEPSKSTGEILEVRAK